VLIVMLVLLRVVCLDSDAYARLSWSSALLTDEGFYLHNARNLILFGHQRTDDFNNALIMPLLHFLQVVVFRVAGVGVVQARSLSVVTSLLTLLVFFCAMRRAFSPRTAWLSLLLLGLDPVFTLYNRLALMDTPACLPLVCGFYAWVRARERPGPAGTKWLMGCGLCLGLAYTVRGLAAVVVPVPLLLLLLPALRQWQQRRQSGQELPPDFQPPDKAASREFSLSSCLALLVGLALVLGVYLLLWYLPHHEEIARVNAYYLHHQLLPRNIHTLLANLQAALMDRHRGVVSFLMTHSPILFLLGCIRILQNLHLQKQEQQNSANDHANYLSGWFLIMLLFVSTVDYAPSRYYVLFYPALAGLAALSLDALLRRAAQGGRRTPAGAVALIVAAWVGMNAYWYADWITHLTYRQRDADHWLAAHLPANSVLLGAVAPGLCLNNRLRCVPVIEDLCNDNAPVEKFADSPCYILILDGDYDGKGNPPSAAQLSRAERWKERWWMRHYPDLVRPEARLHAFPAMLRPFFTIGVYPVPHHLVNRSSSDHLKRSLRNVR
jgi:4-amino-4-deoxy-L-arabinose transferase-like glycosyltransferase